MMHGLLVIWALLVNRGLAQFLSGYSFGAANQTLSAASCTITPGPSPDGQTGYTLYGCEISSPGKYRLWGTILSQPPGAFITNCQPGKGDWCLMFEKVMPGAQPQRIGGYALKGTDSITFQFNLGKDGQTWTINAMVNGKQVSSFNSNSGPLKEFNVVYQCYKRCVPASTPVKFTNLVATLSVADPNFGKKGGIQTSIPGNVQASPETSDPSGKVWTVNQVTVQPGKGH